MWFDWQTKVIEMTANDYKPCFPPIKYFQTSCVLNHFQSKAKTFWDFQRFQCNFLLFTVHDSAMFLNLLYKLFNRLFKTTVFIIKIPLKILVGFEQATYKLI